MTYVLAVEDTTIKDNYVTVTALVDEMRLLYQATLNEPEEWAPAFCQASFELDEDESMPTSENSFCEFLANKDLDWQLVDTSDWSLD